MITFLRVLRDECVLDVAASSFRHAVYYIIVIKCSFLSASGEIKYPDFFLIFLFVFVVGAAQLTTLEVN